MNGIIGPGGKMVDLEVLKAILRQDFMSFFRKAFTTIHPGDAFLRSWHIQAICHALQEVAEGKIKRLIINVPPRSLKSSIATVVFPVWMLGRDPAMRIICVSYAHDLSAHLARQSQLLIREAWVEGLYPGLRVDPKKDTASRFDTTQKGYRYATSVGATLTGLGADILIFDDPLKPDDALSETKRRNVIDWFRNTAFTRLDDKQNGAIVVVTQRLHEEDLVGHLLEQDGWTLLSLPAIAEENQEIPMGHGLIHHRKVDEVLQPDREPAELLEEIKRSIGSISFSAQYQQSPVPREGNVIHRKWLHFEGRPAGVTPSSIVQSWDVAYTEGDSADFSVCTTWAIYKNRWHLISVYRARLEAPSLRTKIIELQRLHNADVVLIEDAGPGKMLLQELKASRDVLPIGVKPEGDKVSRLQVHLHHFEAGRVTIEPGMPWEQDLLNELLGFPAARHDDQVDSISQFLLWKTQDEAHWDDVVPFPF